MTGQGPKTVGTKPGTTDGFTPGAYRLTPEHRDAAEAIVRLDGQITHANVHPDFMERLRRRAAALNTHATTSIEGNPLSREEVEAIGETPKARKGDAADLHGRLVRGERAADAPEKLEIRLHLAYFDRLAKKPPGGPLPLDEIRETHARLLTGVLPSGVGEWKTRQNVIVDEAGKEVFYPTPPRRVPAELEALNAWFEDSALPTPIRVAIWFHEFQCIHPFRDGNGRVGRALTHRLLIANGLPGMTYVALDAQFLADRAAYIRAIAAVQTTEWNHTPWVTRFLVSLQRAYEESLDILRGFRASLDGFDGLKRAILTWVVRRGGGSFTRHDFLQAPERAEYHEVSVSNALTSLTKEGYLTATGQRRGRRYMPGPRFRELVPTTDEN